MINKKRYKEVLSKLLNEHYEEIKKKHSGSKDRQQYINGYLTAARALGAFDYDELKEIIDNVHFNAFGKTIEERQKSELSSYSLDENILAIPTYIREGILLDNT
ncbi:MAG: hypothetical protein A4E71_03349 [Smithella sp. PtaU1.Bin162]|nr:MAG: hypothetical protein A4E71_03349 [Smithella sp. PtaU1.Bin162]